LNANWHSSAWSWAIPDSSSLHVCNTQPMYNIVKTLPQCYYLCPPPNSPSPPLFTPLPQFLSPRSPPLLLSTPISPSPPLLTPPLSSILPLATLP
jgi:hypothetical protein